MKLYDAELKIMDVLWREGSITAKRVSEILKEQIGWSKTTTYTVLKKCVEKGAIERREPHFVCHPLVTIDEVREYETTALIKKMYSGSADMLVASMLGQGMLEDTRRLKQIIAEMDEKESEA